DSGRPNIGTTGVTSFGRFDLQPSTRHSLTVEGLFAPATQTAAGLSSLPPEGTTPDTEVNDVFVGVTDRLLLTSRGLLTIRFGVAGHHPSLTASGSGDAILTPEGWRQNWFSIVDVHGYRESVSATWERDGITGAGSHSFSINAGVRHRSMSGSLVDQPIRIVDEEEVVVRSVDFGAAGRLEPSD